MANRKVRPTYRTINEPLYKILRYEIYPDDCIYCGEYATEMDHVPPMSRVFEYKNLNLENEIYLKVPCCSHCNKLLGDSLQTTFIERIDYLKSLLNKLYYKKYKNIKKLERIIEFNEIDGKLKNLILHTSNDEINLRYRYAYNVGYKLYQDFLLVNY